MTTTPDESHHDPIMGAVAALINERELVINRGSADGVTRGMKFRVMTKERPEIQVEGSSDGVDWQPYEFKWKPGPLDRAPRWNAPHQPRLDWQMWFAALGSERDKIWFTQLAERLLENESSVTRLFARNPFPEHAPAYVRARLFKYEFTTADEHRANGDWWKRREVGEYFPAVSLRDLQQ